MKPKVFGVASIVVLVSGVFYVMWNAESLVVAQNIIAHNIIETIRSPFPTTTQVASTSSTQQERTFRDTFDKAYTVEETGSIQEKRNENWWVGSGAYFYSKGDQGSTVLGSLVKWNFWRRYYAKTNPTDTDNGYHPQNIFRLVLKSLWSDLQQEAYFKIVADNLSESPNRNESNGLLLFNRYQDEFNLYYTGIRVDGYVTIKKKINGTYYPLAYERIVFGQMYDRDNNPDLLPKDTWIGVRSDVVTNADGTVTIKVYIDIGKTGNWVLAAEAVDDGVSYGGPVFEKGYAGIRTDFMDVLFDDYSIKEL